MVKETVGCNFCNLDQIPVVEYDADFGLYIQKCKYVGVFNQTKPDVPCKDFGYVQIREGYIEEEKKLVCKKCS